MLTWFACFVLSLFELFDIGLLLSDWLSIFNSSMFIGFVDVVQKVQYHVLLGLRDLFYGQMNFLSLCYVSGLTRLVKTKVGYLFIVVSCHSSTL